MARRISIFVNDEQEKALISISSREHRTPRRQAMLFLSEAIAQYILAKEAAIKEWDAEQAEWPA